MRGTKEFSWSMTTATTVYDMEQQRFFCAANPRHREEYFCYKGRGEVAAIGPYHGADGYGQWRPPFSAFEVGTYRPDAANISRSIETGERINRVSLFYPYLWQLEVQGKTGCYSYPVVMISEIAPTDIIAIIRFCIAPAAEMRRRRIFELSYLVNSDDLKTALRTAKYQEQSYRILDNPEKWGAKLTDLKGRPVTKVIPSEETSTVSFYVAYENLDVYRQVRCWPPYIFTRWWREWRPAHFVERLGELPVEAFCEGFGKYVGSDEYPLKHKFFQVPKWVPIWGMGGSAAISWQQGFIEVIANPATLPEDSLAQPLPDWNWGPEKTCLLQCNDTHVRVLINPFNERAELLWDALRRANKPQMLEDPYRCDCSVPVDRWPWCEPTVELIAELLSTYSG